MKALVYEKAHRLEDFAIKLTEVPEPVVREFDVLVEVRAVGINPGETFMRQTRNAQPGGRVLLGYEFAGTVIGLGSSVRNFKMGDRVFGTGDVSRDGAWAERLAVDHRIIAKIQDKLPFADAASLPIGSLTAWEAIFRDQVKLADGIKRVLIIGGAGAVGSLATQILKAKTKAFIISTASRVESKEWCLKLGAELVVDHSQDIEKQLAAAKIPHIDMILSTAKTAENLSWIAKVLRPFGHLSFVDMSPSIEMSALFMKSATIHTEMVFSRVLNNAEIRNQGTILETIASSVAKGEIKPIVTTRLDKLTAETMKKAHALVEARRTIGKVVIEL